MNSLQYDAHKEAKSSFRKWLDESLQKGAGAAHKWTNAPNAVEAIDPFACGDVIYESPTIAIGHRADKWQQLWARDQHNAEAIGEAIGQLIEDCHNGVGVEQAGYGIINIELYMISL